MSEFGVSRRSLLCGLVAAGAAVPLVAACGGSDSSPSGSGSTAKSTGAGGMTVQASEVPVGGGKLFADQGILVTQPKAGDFRAFSSSCTHQGTTLNTPVDGVITCPLHGSEFSAEDGHNERGPSGSPAGSTPDLPKKKLTVSTDGKTLTIA